MCCFAGNRRPHHHLINTELFEFINPSLVNQRATLYKQRLTVCGINILRDSSTKYSISQGLNDIPTFDDRSRKQARGCAAILVRYNHVLSNINQTSRQITRVGGFQSRVRKTLTGTVGGNEVIVYCQTFTEICGDRVLDNASVRARHQTAHTRKLANLRR